jgi:hypothetical protein
MESRVKHLLSSPTTRVDRFKILPDEMVTKIMSNLTIGEKENLTIAYMDLYRLFKQEKKNYIMDNMGIVMETPKGLKIGELYLNYSTLNAFVNQNLRSVAKLSVFKTLFLHNIYQNFPLARKYIDDDIKILHSASDNDHDIVRVDPKKILRGNGILRVVTGVWSIKRTDYIFIKSKNRKFLYLYKNTFIHREIWYPDQDLWYYYNPNTIVGQSLFNPFYYRDYYDQIVEKELESLLV